MIALTVNDYLVSAPVSFIAGMIAGWIISNRWAIIRRPPPKKDE